MLTQVPKEGLCKPLDKQRQKPLCFLSGKFTAAQSKWSTPEKEAFPIIHALTRLKHFLCGSFIIFTDHRNLAYIVSLLLKKKPTSERLARWADLLIGYF